MRVKRLFGKLCLDLQVWSWQERSWLFGRLIITPLLVCVVVLAVLQQVLVSPRQNIYARKLRIDLQTSLRNIRQKTTTLPFDNSLIAVEVLKKWENPIAVYTPEEAKARQTALDQAAAAAEAQKAKEEEEAATAAEAEKKRQEEEGAAVAAAEAKAEEERVAAAKTDQVKQNAQEAAAVQAAEAQDQMLEGEIRAQQQEQAEVDKKLQQEKEDQQQSETQDDH
eukprot:TRINITY_DN4721_c0_g1_i1.p2 TRINITY_DN4721_c0_g1~~TRINITY_DN4721_c0_g1_i1.p2  ORF type:complete len:262 (+),score=83.37 TRINITY_DN4721_c0_g1_i1:119-787(+)